MIYIRHFILSSLLLLICLSLFGQGENLDKNQIKNILKGEWEREAIGYEKLSCRKSDRFIMSFIIDEMNINSDGHIEYFSYLSTSKKKEICYLEHGSFSFVFFEISKNGSTINLEITGYLWQENWNLKITDSNNIVLDSVEYKRSNLLKSDNWYKKINGQE